MTLPKDPNMLCSLVNMKLRDSYPSLAAMCEDMDVNQDELVRTLSDAGFHYSESTNSFR